MAYTFNEDVFIVDCWTDTVEKENVLIELLNKLQTYGCPIILCGHYAVNPEIVKLADYFLYIKDNDLLMNEDFGKYGVNSDRWTDMGNYRITNKTEFHHDYAIWITMKHAFKFAESLGKKYIHFLEYDNLPDLVQYRQAFMEYVRNYDAVLYEYDKGSTKGNNPYSSAYIYSIKTEVATAMVGLINSKEEYFKGKPDAWQLEKQLFQSIQKVTKNIFVSKYNPNNNELNIFAAFNRSGILRGNARIQTYLGVDDSNKLYIHFISGFSEKPADRDYLVEINYGITKEFTTIKKGEYYLGIIGDYKQGETVEVFYQGVEIFSMTLKDDVNTFKNKNKIEINKKKGNTPRKMNFHFIDGAFVEILEDAENEYNVQFINNRTNKIEYQTTLKSNHWAKTGIKYFVDWKIKIVGLTCEFEHEHNFDPKGKRIAVCYETKSLGDTVGFFEYINKFAQNHNCEMICASFHNNLFEKQYTKIKFVEPGNNIPNLYALYRLGMFYKTVDGKRYYDRERHPIDPKSEPLMKMASDILGLDYVELRPKMRKLGKQKRKRVSIGIHSTAQAKYWNNPTGWQEVTDYLVSKGYEVRLLSREENGYMGNVHPTGITQQAAGKLEDVIQALQESELFIGISSGLSWLAWAAGTPTILISGFTDESLEPTEGVVRIANKDVCYNCWGRFEFDPGDWNWCPEHKGTQRQFECSKNISAKDVIKEINQLLF